MKSKRIGAAVVLLGVAVASLSGCGTDENVQACLDETKATLEGAGSDRELRQEEIDVCNDPERREFLFGY